MFQYALVLIKILFRNIASETIRIFVRSDHAYPLNDLKHRHFHFHYKIIEGYFLIKVFEEQHDFQAERFEGIPFFARHNIVQFFFELKQV